nr:MAG TPA: hypothetical protein [Caudoviricetes sp.]
MYIGRYLCKAYFRGEIKPSACYEKGSGEWFLSRCVERVLEKDNTNCRILMIGDAAGLTTSSRRGLLGGGAEIGTFKGENAQVVDLFFSGGSGSCGGVGADGCGVGSGETARSIDGGTLTTREVILYEKVEKEFEYMVRHL